MLKKVAGSLCLFCRMTECNHSNTWNKDNTGIGVSKWRRPGFCISLIVFGIALPVLFKCIGYDFAGVTLPMKIDNTRFLEGSDEMIRAACSDACKFVTVIRIYEFHNKI